MKLQVSVNFWRIDTCIQLFGEHLLQMYEYQGNIKQIILIFLENNTKRDAGNRPYKSTSIKYQYMYIMYCAV